MKKLAIFIVVLCCLLSLAACANDSPATKPVVQPTTAPTEPAVKETDPSHVHSWVDATCTAPKTCNSCGATEGESVDHTWTDATCTEPKICKTCGTKEGNPKGHSWDEGVVSKDPTEEADGEKLFTCTVCSETKKEVIPALNHEHSYSATVTAPTCTKEGYTTHTCRCGDSYKTDTVAALGHDWVDATCTEPKTCKTCSATEGDAKGHQWQDATCTAPQTCKICGTTNGTAKGHDFTNVVTAPTCTESGYTTHTCHCGESFVDSYVNATGHTWKAATCTEPKICNTCGATEGTPNGHDWLDATCTNPKTCKVCNAMEGAPLSHAWKAATCTNPKTCAQCGVSDGNTLGHDWSEATCTSPKTCSRCKATEGSPVGHNWTEATCTSPKTCTKCNATEGSPLAHSYTATKTPATCTTQGYTTYVCKCGHSYVADYVTASHNYHKYVCTSCSQVDKTHAHEYLIQYIKERGTTHGTQTIIKDVSQEATFELLYDEQTKYASLMMYFYADDQFFFTEIDLDVYYYYTSFSGCKVSGYLDSQSFTKDSAISYSKYEGDTSIKQDIIELSRISCCDILDWLSWYLEAYDVGITIADLGFTSY